jgi:O-antigen/teichoic acid export membrane protein
VSPASADDSTEAGVSSGAHEQHLAVSTVAQQATQVVGVITMLLAVTVLARHLSLAEFGTYGLLLSLSAYVLYIQQSVEAAAVKTIAEAQDQSARDQAFSTALGIYVVAGLGAALLITAVGAAVVNLVDIPPRLHDQAQNSVLALAVMTGIGLPFRIFQDVLRGTQRFVASALAEMLAYLVVGTGLVVGGLIGAQLWILVLIGAALPFATGIFACAIAVTSGMSHHYRRSAIDIAGARQFLGLSTYLFLMGVADLLAYSLDRVILGAFRSAAAVGLYEGPIRAHNFIRQIHGTLAVPVLPAATRYLVEHDVQRTRDLLLRGTRYTLAAVIPFTIVLMVLARPILIEWLGPKFSVAATALTLLAAYWLFNANTGVAGTMLFAAGRVRPLTVYALAVAIVNVLLSLALTPSLGLNGVVLGTTISNIAAVPFLIAMTLRTFPVTLEELAREAWLPAYVTGALVAAALLVVRVSFPLDSLLQLAGLGLVAVLGYWAIYYAVWLRPNERLLMRNVAAALVRR